VIVKRSFDPRKVAGYVWKDIALAVGAAAAVYAVYAGLGATAIGLSFAPLGLVGSALAIFLAFRASSAFARWGEAAQSWAAITAASRIFSRLVVTFVDSHRHTSQYDAAAAEPFKRELVYRQIAWAHTLRMQLRGQAQWAELCPWLPAAELTTLPSQPNPATFLMRRQGERIYDGMGSGILQGFDSFQMESQLAALAVQQALCERIKSIPVPRQYDYFTRLFVRIFVLIQPSFLIKTLAADGVAWLVIPLAGLIAFLFTTIERTGAVNEEPFENRITDVPLTAMCRQIERELCATLGETDLPPQMLPQEGYLW
jgi:ion channel-forming bestrophin family protein